MLYGKINPTAKINRVVSPFETNIVEAEYMTAYARPYGLGATNVIFEVVFGNITTAEDGTETFQALSSSQSSLSSEQIQNWGIDDTVALNEIAIAIGTTVESTVEIADKNIIY